MTELKDCIIAPGDIVTDGTRIGRIVERSQWVRTAVLVHWDGMPWRTAKLCSISRLRPTSRHLHASPSTSRALPPSNSMGSSRKNSQSNG